MWRLTVDRCNVCAGKVITQLEVEKTFAARGYKLLSQYQSNQQKLEFICPEGHHHSMRWNDFKYGGSCAWCLKRLKTDEDREIVLAGERILRQMTEAVSRYQLRFKPSLSKYAFAQEVAKNLTEALGVRPPGYHIDHIVPQSFFDLRNHDEVVACWSVSNLRYLSLVENSRRCNRLTIEEAEQFTPEQIEILRIASRKPRKWDEWLSDHC